MSLKFWLPLNGNLENRGLSNNSITSTGITVDDNGKIGKCYSFSNGYLRFKDPISSANTEFSIAMWFKTSTPTTTQCLWNGRTTTGKSVAIFIVNGYIRFDDDAILSDTTTALSADTWYHVACTWKKNGKKCIYINGIKKVSSNSSTALTKSNTYATVGMSSKADSSPEANAFTGCINDIRVYNHQLSDNEVKKLSQGLIAHYRLSGGGNTNLAKTDVSGWTRLTKTSVTKIEDDTNFYGLDEGDIFTYSIKLKCISGESTVRARILFYDASGAVTANLWGNTINVGTCGYSTITKVMTADLLASAKMRLSIHVSGETTFEYAEVKLEKGNKRTAYKPENSNAKYSGMGYDSLVEPDCSGLGNSLIKSSVLSNDAESPMNESCTVFNGSTDRYYQTNFVAPLDEYTLSCWYNSAKFDSAAYWIVCLNGNGGSEKIQFGFSQSSTNRLKAQSQAGITKDIVVSPVANTWYFLVLTVSNNVMTAYANGVNKGTIDLTGDPIRRTNFNIGCRSGDTPNTTPVYFANGKISDVRIYGTALSQDDITELYNMNRLEE